MSKSPLCVGVDIGASSIKLCQLGRKNAGYSLQRLATCPLPPQTIVDGAVMNAGNVVDALRELFSAHKVREKKVALSISGHGVIIKKLVLPPMAHDELLTSVELQADELLPFDIKDVYFDAQTTGPCADGSGKMDVLFVAARKDYVQEYTAVIAEAGLTPVVCDVDAFALETAFAACHPPATAGAQANVALVDAGSAKTVLHILQGGKSGMTRELAIGGATFSEQLQRTLHISFEQAEAFKRGDGKVGLGTADLARAETALDETLDALAEALSTSFDYAMASGKAPTAAYLCGGATKLAAFMTGLQKRLQIPVQPLNALQNIHIEPQDAARVDDLTPMAAVAVGLAMRFAGDC